MLKNNVNNKGDITSTRTINQLDQIAELIDKFSPWYGVIAFLSLKESTSLNFIEYCGRELCDSFDIGLQSFVSFFILSPRNEV